MSELDNQTINLPLGWIVGLLKKARIVESSLTDVDSLSAVEAGDRTKSAPRIHRVSRSYCSFE